jgi:hypothetical protein
LLARASHVYVSSILIEIGNLGILQTVVFCHALDATPSSETTIFWQYNTSNSDNKKNKKKTKRIDMSYP